MSEFDEYIVDSEPEQKETDDARLNENNIDEFGQYTQLSASISPVLAKTYFKQQ